MPQNPPALADVQAVNATPLQEVINLSAGSMIAVGNPGGPVVFTNSGEAMVPSLNAGAPRSIVVGR